MSATFKLPVHILIACTWLSACGGGGGSSPINTPTTPTSYPLQAAIAARVNSGITANVSCTGTASNVPFTAALTYTVTAATSATFEGQAALANAATLSGTITVNGMTNPFSNGGHTIYSSPANYATLGDVSSTSYNVQTTPSTIGATVKVGDTGSEGVETSYSDSTKTTVLGTTTTTYAVTADATSASVLITDTAVSKDANGNVTETDFVTYRVTASGTTSLVSLGIQGASSSGNTLTCRAQ